MAYQAKCPICKTERSYDNSIHLYLSIKGEKEYVCLFCENLLRSRRYLEDPFNPQFGYKIMDMNGRIFVQRFCWTECEIRSEVAHSHPAFQ